MKKISSFTNHRKNNAKIFYEIFGDIKDIILQKYNKDSSFSLFHLFFPNTKNKELIFNLFDKDWLRLDPLFQEIF